MVRMAVWQPPRAPAEIVPALRPLDPTTPHLELSFQRETCYCVNSHWGDAGET